MASRCLVVRARNYVLTRTPRRRRHLKFEFGAIQQHRTRCTTTHYGRREALHYFNLYNLKMRLLWSAVVIAAASTSVSAFAPANNGAALMRSGVAMSAVATADVKAKQDASVEKLKAKDASSAALSGDVSFLLSRDRKGDLSPFTEHLDDGALP